MESLPFLPDNVLRRQVCQECFKYLSVPPIASNVLGETICGRCFNSNEYIQNGNKYIQSLYNIIAEGFSFKCINHYNGCNQLLKLTEAKEHEETCVIPKQECFFCSFSGVVSQILYHSLKVHPDNVTYDGKFVFFLNDVSFQKQIIFISNENIFLVTINITEELITVRVSSITQTVPPMKNQFGVRFFKPDDHLSVNYLQRNYGLLEVNLDNYFEKSTDELTAIFGSGEKVCCQVLIGYLAVEKELEFKQKFLKLSQTEKELSDSMKKLDIREQDFVQQTDIWEKKFSKQEKIYNSALDVIKKMSWNFKCNSCHNVALAEIYFCPKKHFYCKICLRNICQACDSVQEFKLLNDIGNLLVPCEWSGCNEMLCVKDYMKHKAMCLNRSYNCPVCHVEVISSKNLLEHSQLSRSPLAKTFIQDSSISCGMDQQIDCYWVVEGDLYHIVLEVGNQIRILIDDVDVLNNVTFKCKGINTYGKDIDFSNFCGKYDIRTANVNNYYTNINVYFD